VTTNNRANKCLNHNPFTVSIEDPHFHQCYIHVDIVVYVCSVVNCQSPDGDELQKAIAASLQDTQGILGGQVSREEQDISRYVMFIIYLKLIFYCCGFLTCEVEICKGKKW
jgi:hypothetical protein